MWNKIRLPLAITALAVVMIATLYGGLAAQSSWQEMHSDVRVRGRFMVDGQALMGDMVRYIPQSVTVGASTVITPESSYIKLTSAASIGTRMIVTGTQYRDSRLLLHNIGSFTVTLTNTAPLVLGANVVLGPNESTELIGTGTTWVKIGY